jgi:hypothetical protein
MDLAEVAHRTRAADGERAREHRDRRSDEGESDEQEENHGASLRP